jgi:hypothetical protein
VTGWTQVRERLKSAHPNKKKHPRDPDREIIYPREKPGLFVFTNCSSFIETVPVLPRDEKNMDDIDTDAEDHVADEVRYLVRFASNIGSSGSTTGV